MTRRTLQRRIVFDARMSPATFRAIARWMMDRVEDYDRQERENR
ncbi:MAG TPA: hypothetical protein PKV78_13350 [Methanoculleus thermophilus]|jgi:hypothetical protein|nr:hypothetical protein [Methanoculleus thermophilus]